MFVLLPLMCHAAHLQLVNEGHVEELKWKFELLKLLLESVSETQFRLSFRLSLGFGLLVEQRKQFEDWTLGKCDNCMTFYWPYVACPIFRTISSLFVNFQLLLLVQSCFHHLRNIANVRSILSVRDAETCCTCSRFLTFVTIATASSFVFIKKPWNDYRLYRIQLLGF